MWQHIDDATAFSQQAAEEREQRRREYLAAEERRRQQQIARQMPVAEKDRQYRKLLEQLSLDESHRQLLLARGFTDEQIIEDGYRTVVRWQKTHGLSLNLPGALPHGSLNISDRGILCPIKNKGGQIVGMQARLDESMNGRYRWLTSATEKNPGGSTPHVDGELPIGVYEPKGIDLTIESIWIAEGTTLKPSLLRNKLRVPVIGAASGRFTSSPNASKASAEYLSNKYKTKLLTFAIDAGDVINKCGVPERWTEQFQFFRSLGYTCRVAWWGQVTKEHNDIDELEDYSVITYITPQEFWSIVEEHRTKNNQPTSEVIETTEVKTPSDWYWQQWLSSRKFTPDIVLDQAEFSFPDLPDEGIIAAVKSGLGTGKTNAMIQLMKIRDHVRSMVVGYRNNLLLQTIERAIAKALTLYHLREDDGMSLLADVHTKLLFCLDSIHLVDGYFTGIDLYIDEIVSVLIHATGGGTLGDNQPKALKIFTRALQVCKRVIILDGNLSDIHADFIAKLAPNKKLIKIENTRKIPPHIIKIIDGIDEEEEVRKGNRSPLLQVMIDPDVRPWIFCDSKEKTKIYGKILTDAGRRGYVLNSETTGEDWAKEFLKDANVFIEKYKPDFMIISPTAESGVSVTIKGHFTHKFSIFVGVQGTNSQHQAMFRLRDNSIPHYLFCPERSNVQERSNPQTYSIKQLQQMLNERIMYSGFLASQFADNSTRALEVIGQAIARQDDKWWSFSCELGALDNFEMQNYRKCLIHALEEAGHNVEVLQWDIDDRLTELEKEVKKQIQREHAKELYVVAPFDSVEEASKKAKTGPNKQTQRRIEKTFLLDKIPGIDETSVWNEDFIYECHVKDKQFISNLQRFWMVKNFNVSQKRHESAWFYQATKEDFLGARVKAMSHDVVWALRELNILQFIEIDYHKDSPEVVEFMQTLRQRRDIQLALRINNIKPETSSGDERIATIGSILRLIGHKNVSCGKRFVDGVRLMHHTAKPAWMKVQKKKAKAEEPEFDFASAQEAILEAIARKFSAWMESDKAKVSWEPEPVAEEVIQKVAPTTVSPLQSAVEHLQKMQRWDEMTLGQEMLDQAWGLLTLQEQQRLTRLHEEYKSFVQDDRYAMLTEMLPECEDGDTVLQLIGTIDPGIAMAAVRSLATDVRSRIMSLCAELRSLFGGDDLSPATG